MEPLTIKDFDKFFEAVHDNQPFIWQRTLCENVAASGCWPDQIAAPTGTGKSNVVDIHAFLNALYGWGEIRRVPRRLAVIVDRRSIVDSHQQRAEKLMDVFAKSDSDVVRRVVEGLTRLKASQEGDPLVLARLRGGVPRDSAWIDDPTACAVICATPQMWGSRLLFRGYGSSKLARPREAGLLARDAVMVLDEAHLNRQLLSTARSVSKLVGRHESPVPALQVVETSATPSADATSSITVWDGESNTIADPALVARLTNPKPLVLRASSAWTSGERRVGKPYVVELVSEVVDAVKAHGERGTVGCVVNTVDAAVRVAADLKREYGDDAVIQWIGRMRPMDLDDLRNRHPGAFTANGDAGVRVVVATQTVEVGVDVDFAALVTELAPATAIAQRVGRVNRCGKRPSGPVTILVPTNPPAGRAGPYDAESLLDAYSWLREIEADGADLSPAGIRASPPPPARTPRPVFSRIEAGDAIALSVTSENVANDFELALWLEDDLSNDTPMAGVVLRKPLPDDDVEALALLKVTPPQAAEIFPSRVFEVEALLESLRGLSSRVSTLRRAFVFRAGSVQPIDFDTDSLRPEPGDVIVIDGIHRVIENGMIVPVGQGQQADRTLWDTIDGQESSDDAGDRVFVAPDSGAEFLKTIARLTRAPDVDVERTDAESRRSSLSPAQELVDQIAAGADLVESVGPDVVAAIRSLGDKDNPPQLIAPTGDAVDKNHPVPWAVLRRKKQVLDSEEDRQTWVQRAVTLADHSAAVADRSQQYGSRLGLSPRICESLRLAGRHHDDGKEHRLFQEMLQADGEPLAKSRLRSIAETRRRGQRSGLPRGWRHEQLSVVLAEPKLRDRRDVDVDLILRLIGTSHGRGRSGFHFGPKSALSGWLDDEETACRLYDRGDWEALVDNTHRTIGVWDCAYLEAILRAADCQVSKEGS